jgi:hypothetical protein
MAFRVGQKVVCVEAGDFFRYPGDPTGLELNSVYTVAYTFQMLGENLVNVAEIRKGAFNAVRFRPATDIGVFYEILKRESVDA